MANSRIMLTCKHCGKQMIIGKGYFGEYVTYNTNIFEELNEFYEEHSQGSCSDNYDGKECSDDAKDHFIILEEWDDENEYINKDISGE
jgi:hypothetical protein